MLELAFRARAAFAVAVALLSAPVVERSARAEAVGHVEKQVGEASLWSRSTERGMAPGTRIRVGDLLRTDLASHLTLVFADGSRLLVGPDTRLSVTGYSSEQGRSPGVLMLGLEAGAIRLVATPAARAPAKRLEVRSAHATVTADNGVDVWCGVEDGRLAVLVLAGRAKVANWSGSVLVERRRGTVAESVVTPPEPAYGWDRERIRRALASAGAR